jgi:hypothetical protein
MGRIFWLAAEVPATPKMPAPETRRWLGEAHRHLKPPTPVFVVLSGLIKDAKVGDGQIGVRRARCGS